MTSPPTKRLSCAKCGGELSGRTRVVDDYVTCPDCGARFHVVRTPRAAPPAQSVALATSNDPVDDLLADINKTMTAATSQGDDIDDLLADINKPEAPGEKRRVPDVLLPQRELNRAEIPKPPKMAFWSGVFEFPWYLSTLPYWMGMSLGIAFVELFSMGIIGALLGDEQIAIVGSGFSVIGLAWAVLLTSSFCGACFLATLQGTADGHDIIPDWPDMAWKEWVFSSLRPLMMLVIGEVVAYIVTYPLPTGAVFASAGIEFILFPFLLLSSMEADSYLPVSAPIAGTLRSLPSGWLLFYTQTAGVVLAWFGSVWLLSRVNGFLAGIVAAPLLAAAMLIYARLLGRLAWRSAQE